VKYLARSSRASVRERFANEKLSTEVCGSVEDGPELCGFADMTAKLSCGRCQVVDLFAFFVRHLPPFVDQGHLP